jgi:hypothetical protein
LAAPGGGGDADAARTEVGVLLIDGDILGEQDVARAGGEVDVVRRAGLEICLVVSVRQPLVSLAIGVASWTAWPAKPAACACGLGCACRRGRGWTRCCAAAWPARANHGTISRAAMAPAALRCGRL